LIWAFRGKALVQHIRIDIDVMSVVMDNDAMKQKAMDGQFYELEQAGKLVKAMNWLITKLTHAKEKEALGIVFIL
jgi:hypothetical protein